jgi:prevent-host-death family protein
MKTVVISEFKAKCIRLLKDVKATRTPLVVTVRGEPLVTILPYLEESPQPMLGTMKGQVTIHGDIVHADWSGDWEEEEP